MKKPIKIFISFLIVLIALIVATIMITRIINTFEKNSIPDMNGAENFALNTITMEQIVNKELGSYQKMAGFKGTGEQTKIRDGRLEEYDYTQISAHAKSFSGVSNLQATLSDHDTLILDIESTVASGNFALIVLIDGDLHSEIPINQSTQIKLEGVAGKTVIVRMAGESAEYEICVIRSFEG